jgi:hypothetical protein
MDKGRRLLSVVQLGQATEQARAQFKLSFVQVGYQADVGGPGKRECEAGLLFALGLLLLTG